MLHYTKEPMIQDFKRVLRRLTPLELATRELVDAELALLEAQTGVDYAAALVSYNAKRVERLRKYVATAGERQNTGETK